MRRSCPSEAVLRAAILAAGALAAHASADCGTLAPVAAPEAMAHDHLGRAVDLDGDCVVVGAPSSGKNPSAPGRALVYRLKGGAWTFEATLVASDGDAGDRFGASVAIAGDVILVGAPYAGDESGFGAGRAHVFRLGGEGWNEEAILDSGDSADAGDGFGTSVAIEGDTAIVGAVSDSEFFTGSGAAYVFAFDGRAWSLQQSLSPTGSQSFGFGFSVALSGDRVVVGGRGYGSRVPSGAATFFRREGASWLLEQEVFVPGNFASAFFGVDVALSGANAVVGSHLDYTARTGSATFFRFDGSVWSDAGRVVPPDGAVNDFFGCDVDLDEGTAIIGAFGDDTQGQIAGAAYVYVLDGDTWEFSEKLLPTDGAGGDYCGLAVAVEGGAFALGAPGRDEREVEDAGLLFVSACPTVTGDLDGDGAVGAADLAALLGAWGPCAECGTCAPDLDGDCLVAASDLAILLASWTP